MASVLTEGSRVTCGHQPGRVTAAGPARLQVDGQPVLTRSGVAGHSVSGCGTVASSDVSGPVNTPCTTVTTIGVGEATKLFVEGAAVLLDTLSGGTDGLVSKTPAQSLSATSQQTKLETQ